MGSRRSRATIHATTVNRRKKREVSAWVKQNLIKPGKLLGADFQGHEEEAMQLLLQVDRAIHQKVVAVCKKTRFKGSNELKSLVAFAVKFQSGGCRDTGRNFRNIS